MKLTDFLKDKALVEFDVVRVQPDITESGEKIAILYLKTPIPVVQGTQFLKDGASGASERVEAYDVESVKIHERDMDAEGININEDGTGKVTADKLRLDVSGRTGETWLTSQSFASFGRNKRAELKNERRGGLITKMQERKTQATFKGGVAGATANKPQATVVANEEEE